jgi:SAM-dependent methyltransferase
VIPEALAPYERALSCGRDLQLVTADGIVMPLEIGRYLGAADVVDQSVVARVVPPVLDVGCGPGRIVHAVAAAGLPALGVDIADYAVALTKNRGVPALTRSVFQRIPGEGRWPTVLVLDGNIGIGGDVGQLLRRLIDLMAPGGSLIVEASTGSSVPDEVLSVRFRADGLPVGPAFDWAVVDRVSLLAHAARAGLSVPDQWSVGGRDFARFARATVSDVATATVTRAMMPISNSRLRA